MTIGIELSRTVLRIAIRVRDSRPRPGPIAMTVLSLRSSPSGHASGAVINSGIDAATTDRQSGGVATVTSPAPARRAALPAIAAAPDLPGDPPTIKTLP